MTTPTASAKGKAKSSTPSSGVYDVEVEYTVKRRAVYSFRAPSEARAHIHAKSFIPDGGKVLSTTILGVE